ncbi:metal-sulfur cluster assembly factor [Horticoccus luteus]|uniref:Metal-sulfur cluster assembly factor n=1 Tax=Horticoccus luteus TaxID=2862869 RepID=A0A8F9XH36_9BACT|nr:iron-sulfur cluster assembly protein [Horticoccus luteus]QYM78895.1 metal-sulfur cluster assembly factor [Horticoccus luteus]
MNAPLDSTAVWDALRGIPDPEFGINIVDLGLIYSVECHDGAVAVTMTLTTPSCPSGGWIYEGAKQAVANLPGATKVDVAMVFDPPWSPAMLSEAANRQLGRID